MTPSPALGKANAQRNLMQFCSREKDFMATVGSAAQLNQSLPQGRGRGTAVGFPEASVRALGVRTRRWMRMHRSDLQQFYKSKFENHHREINKGFKFYWQHDSSEAWFKILTV